MKIKNSGKDDAGNMRMSNSRGMNAFSEVTGVHNTQLLTAPWVEAGKPGPLGLTRFLVW